MEQHAIMHKQRVFLQFVKHSSDSTVPNWGPVPKGGSNRGVGQRYGVHSTFISGRQN